MIRRLVLALALCGNAAAGEQPAADLQEIHRQALEQDPRTARAEAALGASREAQNQAHAALWLPVARLTGNFSRYHEEVRQSGSFVGFGGNFDYNAGQYGLTLTQPLLHLERYAELKARDANLAAAEAQWGAARQNLILRAAERYFAVLAAEDRLRYAQAQEQALARGLAEIQQRWQAGFAAGTDAQEAQAGADQAAAEVVEAEQALQDAQAGLQEMTGREYRRLAVLREEIPLDLPEPAREEAWAEHALAWNLDLLAASALAQSAEADIRRRGAGHWPTLDLVGSHVFSTAGGRFGGTDIQDTAIGIALDLPLYEGGRVESRVREARFRYGEALANLKESERAVRRDTRRAYLGVVSGSRRVRALQQSLRSGELAVRATRAAFQAGRRTPLDLIVAERELLRIQRDYASSRYEFLLNGLRLKQAVGTLAATDLEAVNALLRRP